MRKMINGKQEINESKPRTLRSELIQDITNTKQVLENIRKRPKLNCMAVAAQISIKDKTKTVDATHIEKAENKFRKRWKIQKALKEQQVLLPKNMQTLKLLYGERESPKKDVVQIIKE